jgi:hypothetical protein
MVKGVEHNFIKNRNITLLLLKAFLKNLFEKLCFLTFFSTSMFFSSSSLSNNLLSSFLFSSLSSSSTSSSSSL